MARDDDPSGFSEAQSKYIPHPSMGASRMDGSLYDDDPHAELVGGIHLDAAFTAEDARQRKGNYIIPFGLTSSGKTTFLASLFKYIDESPLLDSQIVIPERQKVPNYAGQAMLNDWQKVFNTGRFLDATEVGDMGIRELTYDVQPNKGQRTKLQFNVIEVSGEDLEKVIAKDDHDPSLPTAIEAVFKNKNIRPLIVLVVHPNQIHNDLLFSNLLTWLSRNVQHRVKTFSLAVIVANPALALSHLHKRRAETRGQKRLDSKLAILYLQVFAPKTFAIFNGWTKSKRAIIPFYVGQIERIEQGQLAGERIVQFDNRNASQMFGWIYYQFTGRKLGRSLLQRLFRKLND